MVAMEDLVAGAVAATGDEGIDVAGIFIPRGFVGSSFVGAFVGASIGALGGPIVMGIAAAAGGVGGGKVAEKRADDDEQAWRFCVAVSPDSAHVLAIDVGAFDVDLDAMHVVKSFDRDTVRVEVHGHATFRRLVLEDPESHDRIELDGYRHAWKHASDVIHRLLLDEEHAHAALEEDPAAAD